MGYLVDIGPYIEKKKQREPSCENCEHHRARGDKLPNGHVAADDSCAINWRMDLRTKRCMDFKRRRTSYER